MSPTTKRTIRRSARAVLASVAATVAVLAGLSTPASAVALPMALSAGYGPSGGGGTIIGTITPTAVVPSPIPANTTPVVQFQYVGTGAASCGSTAKAITQIAGTGTTTTAGVLTVNPTAVKRITASKIAFQVPSGSYPGSSANPNGLVLVGTQTSAKWNICVYDSASTTSSVLLATASYTLVLKPTISSISPASSPAGGGQTITVNGAGFTAVTTAITGSIGGAALSNIKIASNGNSFTATTGARAPGSGLAVTVTAPGGTVSSLDPDNDPSTSDTPIPFTYSNGITISPNTGASGTQVTIDVTGAGFMPLHFDSAGHPTSSLAHVFLVKDGYLAASNRGVAECVVDIVVSDTELVCTLDLSANQLDPSTSATVPGSPIADGAYILTVVENGTTGAGSSANPSIISSGAAFIVAPY